MNLIVCALVVFVVSIHLLFANCEKLVPLQCYVCNSNYQKCGQSADFDRSVQYTSPCYGYCVKINVYPGDFVIRTCTTLLANNVNNQSLSLSAITAQQCYLDRIYDTVAKTTQQAYYCYCNDRVGCNNSPLPPSKKSSPLLVLLSLVLLAAARFITTSKEAIWRL